MDRADWFVFLLIRPGDSGDADADVCAEPLTRRLAIARAVSTLMTPWLDHLARDAPLLFEFRRVGYESAAKHRRDCRVYR